MNTVRLREGCEALQKALDPSLSFGITRIQRVTRLGYVEANELARYGLDNGYLRTCQNSPQRFLIIAGGPA
tara:strand:- start:1477 stop:1689 length:213 start_codon:yes stop_codon:yes gene_type:complete